MAIKWSILAPALVLVALSGYYISTDPPETTVSAALVTPQPVTLSLSPEMDTPTPEILPPPEEPLPSQEIPPVQEEFPPTQEELPPEEETTLPEEPPIDEESPPDGTEEMPLAQELPPPEEPDNAEGTPPVQEDEPSESSDAQPLSSDIYDLAGSYTSDQGIPVTIQFIDGFYHISFQGISDSHRTITELSPPGSDQLELSIVPSSLPVTISLVRTSDGTLMVDVYLEGSESPMLSATVTKDTTPQ